MMNGVIGKEKDGKNNSASSLSCEELNDNVVFCNDGGDDEDIVVDVVVEDSSLFPDDTTNDWNNNLYRKKDSSMEAYKNYSNNNKSYNKYMRGEYGNNNWNESSTRTSGSEEDLEAWLYHKNGDAVSSSSSLSNPKYYDYSNQLMKISIRDQEVNECQIQVSYPLMKIPSLPPSSSSSSSKSRHHPNNNYNNNFCTGSSSGSSLEWKANGTVQSKSKRGIIRQSLLWKSRLFSYHLPFHPTSQWNIKYRLCTMYNTNTNPLFQLGGTFLFGTNGISCLMMDPYTRHLHCQFMAQQQTTNIHDDHQKVTVHPSNLHTSHPPISTTTTTTPTIPTWRIFSQASTQQQRGMTQFGIQHNYIHSTSTSTSNRIQSTLEWNVATSTATTNTRPFSLRFETSNKEFHISMGSSSSIDFCWQLQTWWKSSSWGATATSWTYAMGILYNNSLGLAWTWRFIPPYSNHILLEIPIYLSPSSYYYLTTNNIYNISFMNLCSYIIHNIITKILLPKLIVTSQKQQQQEQQQVNYNHNMDDDSTSHTKKQFELQSQLMSRKASSSRKQEEAIQGLVILSAIYGYSSKTTIQSSSVNAHYDVTIPLQFWVTNSKLKLPSNSSKRHLLGFPNLKSPLYYHHHYNDNNNNNDDDDDETHNEIENISSSYWFKIISQHLISRKNMKQHEGAVVTSATTQPEKKMIVLFPQLRVRYQMNNSVFEIQISDEEGLTLPHPHAIPVSSKECENELVLK